MEIRILELLNEIKSLIIGKVNERWLTLKEVSEYTSLSESTIRRAIQKGVLKSSNKTGSFVDLTVVSDVKVDGKVVIKAGAQAQGNVSSAKKAAAFGSPGEIAIQVTSVRAVDGTNIPVQAMSSDDGDSQVATAIILGLLCIVGFFIPGGEGEISSGVVINCRTLGDIDVKV